MKKYLYFIFFLLVYNVNAQVDDSDEKVSISKNKIANIKFQWQLYRELEKLSIIQSFYYMLWYTFYGIRKYSNLF